jgi:hypothetical protein
MELTPSPSNQSCALRKGNDHSSHGFRFDGSFGTDLMNGPLSRPVELPRCTRTVLDTILSGLISAGVSGFGLSVPNRNIEANRG